MDYKLEFDPEKHEYRVNGKIKPGISEILKVLGLSKDYTNVDPFYRERGIAVHKCIELWVKDQLELGSVDPVCIPYVEGFQKFWLEKRLNAHMVQAVEEPMYSQRLDFCGTADLIIGDVIFDYKCSKMKDTKVAQNLKTGEWDVMASNDAYELQGAMQQQLWAENDGSGVLVPFRVLQLPGDGTYRILNYNTKDMNLADSVMSLYRWKMKGK